MKALVVYDTVAAFDTRADVQEVSSRILTGYVSITRIARILNP
jgi:hypothetical protein